MGSGVWAGALFGAVTVAHREATGDPHALTDLETTEIYTRVSIRQLQAIHSACHAGAPNTRHRSPNHPALANTPRHDDDADVQGLPAALDQEVEEENRLPTGSGRSAAGDTAALDDPHIEEQTLDHRDHRRAVGD